MESQSQPEINIELPEDLTEAQLVALKIALLSVLDRLNTRLEQFEAPCPSNPD